MVGATKDLHPIPLPHLMLLSGLAASWGEACSIPFDTAKVRLQLQEKLVKAAASAGTNVSTNAGTNEGTIMYKGLWDCINQMSKREGKLSLWRGINAGIQRQMVFGPIRIGLYEPVRNFYTQFSRTPTVPINKPTSGSIASSAPDGTVAQPPPPPSLLLKIAAGVTTSAIGITIATPTDVAKVNLQANRDRYKGVLDAYRSILKNDGVKGLWKGYFPNLARNTLISATELVVYDQAKQTFLAYHFPDNLSTHFMSALTAGFVATALGSPVDVVKTNVMNATADSPFKGPISCATYLFKTQGPMAFYKGFVPNFARIGTWTIVAFTTLEQLKLAYWKVFYPN